MTKNCWLKTCISSFTSSNHFAQTAEGNHACLIPVKLFLNLIIPPLVSIPSIRPFSRMVLLILPYQQLHWLARPVPFAWFLTCCTQSVSFHFPSVPRLLVRLNGLTLAVSNHGFFLFSMALKCKEQFQKTVSNFDVNSKFSCLMLSPA